MPEAPILFLRREFDVLKNFSNHFFYDSTHQLTKRLHMIIFIFIDMTREMKIVMIGSH
jgi:hypothetical protein